MYVSYVCVCVRACVRVCACVCVCVCVIVSRAREREREKDSQAEAKQRQTGRSARTFALGRWAVAIACHCHVAAFAAGHFTCRSFGALCFCGALCFLCSLAGGGAVAVSGVGRALSSPAALLLSLALLAGTASSSGWFTDRLRAIAALEVWRTTRRLLAVRAGGLACAAVLHLVGLLATALLLLAALPLPLLLLALLTGTASSSGWFTDRLRAIAALDVWRTARRLLAVLARGLACATFLHLVGPTLLLLATSLLLAAWPFLLPLLLALRCCRFGGGRLGSPRIACV